MENCIFCKIAAGEIPSNKAYEDDKILAFHDINPQAPVHIVVIPKAHMAAGMNDINAGNADMIAHIFQCIPRIAAEAKLENGYRVVCNCGADAGQTVFHIHFHILGGKKLDEARA